MKSQKGLSVVELLIALAMLSIIIVGSFNLFSMGSKMHKSTVSEAEIQSSTRVLAEQVNQITRFSTAAHTVPRTSFQDYDYRDSDWTYVGINKDGDVVIDEPGTPRKVTVIAEKQDGIDYEIEFHRVHEDDGEISDTIVGFSIKGFKDGRQVNEIVSQVEILNALQVEHKGSEADPAVALAFSKYERGSPEFILASPDAHIAMVLDFSGSMTADMEGKNDGTPRYQILIDALETMVDRLSNMGFDIYVSLVPFSTNANNPHEFRNVNKDNSKNELADLMEIIDSIENSIEGWTNTGDGIRRAFYMLEEAEEEYFDEFPDDTYNDFTQHMMILVDGGTNTDTYYRCPVNYFYTGDWYYYFEDKNVGVHCPDVNALIRHFTNQYDPEEADVYVDKVGEDLIQQHIHEDEQIINCFVIGFSNLASDHVSLDRIGEATNAKEFEHDDGIERRFILATDADELDFAFDSFTEEVFTSLWSIYGPRLKED